MWREGVTSMAEGVAVGDVVRVEGPDGVEIGAAVADPGSPLLLRMWALGEAPPLDALFAARLDRALARRAPLFADGATTAYRLVHGEGDRMPGVVIDRYGEVAVVRPDGEAATRVVAARERLLVERLGREGVRLVVSKPREAPPRVLGAEGREVPASVRVTEHGVPFFVDVARGQKTGAFLDQRENRRRVGELVLARGARTALNLFSYAGGFSQRAALAGAKVTSVDVAAQAHATAQRSFKEAGVDPKAHEFVAADAFAFLEDAARAGRTWDVVVSDPPSFAPSEKAAARALASYRRLHKACSRVLAPGGVLCAASCSSHVPMDAFLGTLDDAALGRSDLSLLASYGPPPDHPTLPGWPEGRYLKLCVLA